MKEIQKHLVSIIRNMYFQHFLLMSGFIFSFLILDIGIRYFSNQYTNVYRFTHASPLFFSIGWIIFFLMICYLLPKKGKILFYGVLIGLFNLLSLAQILHMKILNRFFGLSDLLLVSEGSDYFQFALKKTDGFTITLLAISFFTMLIVIIGMKKVKEFSKTMEYYCIVLTGGILLFSSFHFWAVQRLGNAVSENGWEQAYNVKNIYLDFNNQNKNMEVAGLYEQTIRNSYLFVLDFLNVEQDQINAELDDYFDEIGIVYSEKNSYTGKFKGKNLIFILLESIDSFLIEEKTMPTLLKLQKEGYSFTNRYAPVFGGGQTINSEFAANTGLYALDNAKVIYNFDSNVYPYSLANQMKKIGYTVESIHANTAKFYNRSNFHNALGYTNHYALADIKGLDPQYDYFLDSSLAKNKDVLDLIIKEEPFMTFITTYSAHLPYDEENPNCRDNLYGISDVTKELSCIRNLAHDTDEFLRILIEALEERKKLDDTVLVLFSDHYAYGYSNVEEIMNYKSVDNINLIQNVPFIIWSNSIKPKEIHTIMDTADILPTLLNLFGIEYPVQYFVGTDVFSKNHEEFVYFSDSIFYNGELYYDDKQKMTSKNEIVVKDTLKLIQTKRKINEQIILGNYFQYLIKNKKISP